MYKEYTEPFGLAFFLNLYGLLLKLRSGLYKDVVLLEIIGIDTNIEVIVIGIDTNIEVIVVSLTTWEAHHSPRAKPEGCGELPRSLMR